MNNYWAWVCARIIVLIPILLLVLALIGVGIGAMRIAKDRTSCENFGGVFIAGRGDNICLKNGVRV